MRIPQQGEIWTFDGISRISNIRFFLLILTEPNIVTFTDDFSKAYFKVWNLTLQTIENASFGEMNYQWWHLESE